MPPELRQHAPAVYAGHHHIHNDDLRRDLLGQGQLARGPACLEAVRVAAVALER